MANKEGWKVKKLDEACEVNYGTRVVKSKVSGTKYFVYGGGGPTFTMDEYNREDSLIVSRFAMSAQCVRFVKGKFFLNDSGLSLSVKNEKELYQPYLNYHIFALNDTIYNLSKGVAQKNLDVRSFRKLDISIPPLPTQQQIVAELDTLNTIIEKKREQLAELDKLAEATFYSMFGDPVENEKGWEVGKIKDIVTSVRYGTSARASEQGKYKYLRMNNITYNGALDLTNLKWIDVEDKDYEKYVVRKGDILFNRTNSKELVGKTTYFDQDEEMIAAGYLIRVRLQDSFLPVFVSHYLNTQYMKMYLQNLCKNIIGMANINAKELQSIPIYFPPIELQNQFAEKIKQIEQQKSLIEQSIDEVQLLFDATMDRYFN